MQYVNVRGDVMQGWVKLHRKVRGNPIFNDMQLFRLMIICLTEASHKKHEQLVGNQLVHLEPGQFVTGRFDLHAMYHRGLKPKDKVSESTVWRWLEKLKRLDFLNINSNNKFSIVSINNWDLYQNNEQENEQQMNNRWTSNEQQMNTNKNVKNVKNGVNEKIDNYDDGIHSRAVEFFTNNFGQFSPYVSDNIIAWEKDLNADLVIAAMKIALQRNKRNFGYVESILKEWHSVGLKTLEQARAYETDKWERPKQVHEDKNKQSRKPSRRNKHEAVVPKWAKGELIVPDKPPEEVRQRTKELESFLHNL